MNWEKSVDFMLIVAVMEPICSTRYRKSSYSPDFIRGYGARTIEHAFMHHVVSVLPASSISINILWLILFYFLIESHFNEPQSIFYSFNGFKTHRSTCMHATFSFPLKWNNTSCLHAPKAGVKPLWFSRFSSSDSSLYIYNQNYFLHFMLWPRHNFICYNFIAVWNIS